LKAFSTKKMLQEMNVTDFTCNYEMLVEVFETSGAIQEARFFLVAESTIRICDPV